MGRSKRGGGTCHARASQAHALDDVPIIACDDCTAGKEQTVVEMGTSMPGRVATICFWFAGPTKCGICARKAPYAIQKLSGLADGDLPRESVTVEKVTGIMHALMLETCDKMVQVLTAGNSDPSTIEAFRRMRTEVAARYRKERARVTPKTLHDKLKRMVGELEGRPDRLPCKSKIQVECVDGTAVFALTVMGIYLGNE